MAQSDAYNNQNTRYCPTCNKQLVYTRSDHCYDAERKNLSCRSCAGLGHRLSEETKQKLRALNLGKHHSDETKRKISSRRGWHHSLETRQKLSVLKKGQPNHRLGKLLSNETRRKQRIAALNRIKQKTGQIIPNYNSSACSIFEHINKKFGWQGQHAENGGEFHIKELGYWVDYYEPTLNLVIEYDEKKHSEPKQLILDVVRQTEIVNLLKCKFIRIRHTDSVAEILEQLES